MGRSRLERLKRAQNKDQPCRKGRRPGNETGAAEPHHMRVSPEYSRPGPSASCCPTAVGPPQEGSVPHKLPGASGRPLARPHLLPSGCGSEPVGPPPPCPGLLTGPCLGLLTRPCPEPHRAWSWWTPGGPAGPAHRWQLGCGAARQDTGHGLAAFCTHPMGEGAGPNRRFKKRTP